MKLNKAIKTKLSEKFLEEWILNLDHLIQPYHFDKDEEDVDDDFNEE